jgi:hypothetical protein
MIGRIKSSSQMHTLPFLLRIEDLLNLSQPFLVEFDI